MNIANLMTISRIVLSFVCVALILKNTFYSLSAALLVFIFASITDFLDGFLARRNKTVSDLGKLLDPIADKILTIGVFLAFLALNIINVWMVIVIMLREFIITGVRLYVLNKGVVLEAKLLGKHKTVSQIVAIFIIFITLVLFKIYPSNKTISFLYGTAIDWFMWYVLIITLFSGIHYIWINRKLIKTF